MSRVWHAEFAWLPSGVASDVRIEASSERFVSVCADVPRPPGAVVLPGLTLPGFANAHSHAFHRALRGTVGGDSFWTWRDRMYQVAARLSPDSYYALARAVYAEMALAGVSCVGEFHYLHHGAGGRPYADPNAPGHMLMAAASDAGLRITLLDTCYLTGGLSADGHALPLSDVQQRFSDGSADAWAARVEDFGAVPSHAKLGAAIHSVRAVPPASAEVVMAWSHHHGAPVHAHLSEQPAENAECLATYGGTPTQVLAEAGVLGPRSTMVHATHLTSGDVSLLGQTQTCCCFCPTTEADLADGIGPAVSLAEAGCSLSLGSDSNAVIDLLTEARWLELSQRLSSLRRGHFSAGSLAMAATANGHACLGWPDAGEIASGAYADLVTVPLDTPRLAGASASPASSASSASSASPASSASSASSVSSAEAALATVLLAGTTADISNVVISGRDIVRDGRHLLIDDIPANLTTAIRALLS